MTKHREVIMFFHIMVFVAVAVFTIQYSWLTIIRGNKKLGLLKQILPGSHYNKNKHAYKMFFKNARWNLNISDRCPISGFLTIKGSEGLAEMMGEYATIYAYAKQDGLVPVISPKMKETLQKYFPLISIVSYTDFDFSCRFTAKEMNRWDFNKESILDGNYNIISQPLNIQLFKQYKEEIKQEFRFKQHYIDKAAVRIKEVVGSSNDVVLVGVHVRRTDYRDYLELPGADYIRKAMDRYKSKFQNVLFLMVSDDMQWCKSNFKDMKGVYFLGDGDRMNPGTDLAVLSMCNHTIITYGRFGVWGAYLSDGVVTLPDSSSGIEKILVEEIRRAHLPNWTIITDIQQQKYVEIKTRTQY